ncbi:MAG TPA: hypothetical protein VIH82_08600 [Acidimicrobiia bacterium]|jgi:hypothetical protein
MAAAEITINGDGDMVVYDGRVLEIFYLDGSKRFLASRLRYERHAPDRSGAVIVQMWATKAQMVAAIRIEADRVAEVDALLGRIAERTT